MIKSQIKTIRIVTALVVAVIFVLIYPELPFRVNIEFDNTPSDREANQLVDNSVTETGVSYTEVIATYLNVSDDELFFSSEGGEKIISVNTDGTWYINTDTESWGHLIKEGDHLKIRIDKNPDIDTRTDYFAIKAGDEEVKINITQKGSWEVSGSTRSYEDNAVALDYITEQIKEAGECRLGAITEKGKAVVVYGDNGAMWTSIPNSLSDKIKETDKKITSVVLTVSGYYCLVYGRNGWFGHVPEGMKAKLNKYNEDAEEIKSISISENGDYAIVTDEHFMASNDSDHSNMKEAYNLYGSIKDVCITNQGICVVCDRGIYFNNIPSNVKDKLQSIDFRPDHVSYTDSGTFLITTESGRYSYRM